MLLFVIQRRPCPSFRPADEIDPEYGRWLRRAVKAGVEVYHLVGAPSARERFDIDRTLAELQLSLTTEIDKRPASQRE